MTTRDVEEGIESIAGVVRRLSADPGVKRQVDERIAEFMEVNNGGSTLWFREFVYCLLTAYSSAERAQLCVDALEGCGVVLDGGVEEVAETLRRTGHRFANKRAEYIVEARVLRTSIKEIVTRFGNSTEAREWLVANVRGFGWKEASHFLRNVGYLDVAIIDRHIMSNMMEHGLVEEDAPKGLTKRRYLRYEGILKRVADRLGMPVGKMDLYLWYRKTGKVLK